MSDVSLSEQEQIRRQSLEELRKLGIDPYPAAEYKTNAFAQDILDNFIPEKNNYPDVCLAGRIMGRRIMGNASFAELMDSSGRIQIYVRRDEICPGEDKTMYNTVFKRLLDIGDIIGVKGFVFRTKMGETTIHVKEFTILSKSVRPLPVVKEKDGTYFDAVRDPEMRYRQRYIDLIVNPHVRDVFRKRSLIIQSMREFFNSKGYLEVETPILQPIPGGAAARPFITHHNTLDIPLYLRIADELYLKRLIVGGFEGVYEFAKDFRNEGMDRTHNPEFTVMEIYIAYKDYQWMMEFTEEIIKKVALDLHGKTEILYEGKTINLNPPYKRITMLDAIKEYTGLDISTMNENELRSACDRLG
ncbi:MAG TPA: OB-fold nucleic acid binding domain-containing protein, partial [Bacteroidales bacterium]|nr:OB-fold nucleic acid binding domain-containing protein [Bacteroidales bacterium]